MLRTSDGRRAALALRPRTVLPDGAHWDAALGEFVLPYQVVR
ncbi:hypothetical protein [Nocardia caishijiensis]|nr:hypothetical protein [Nocardia caishijiensis]